jgi:hypothetical protein
MTSINRPLALSAAGWLILVAAPSNAGDLKAVVGMSATLYPDPSAPTATAARAPYGATVEILDEKTLGKERFHKVRLPDGKPLGWLKASDLGHTKEFDPSMKPSDAVNVDGLTGLDLTMASIYNARGKYLKEQAAKLAAAPADLAAVLLVESRGRGFDSGGNLVTRFENHVFFRRWGDKHKDVFDQHFTFDSQTKYKGHTFRKTASGDFATFHLNNGKELEVLAFARSLDDTAALESASYGAPQIMGFNHAKIGYKDVQSMVKQFHSGIRPQLDGMIAFIRNTKLCMEGLKNRDYVKFATGYNGKGKENDYAPKIRTAAESYTRVTKGRNASD